ncbi:bacC, partial [Symbiodinium microadriaticum]
DGRALEFASAKLRDDKEIALAAVCHQGRALRFASERLRSNREVVTCACINDGNALEYAMNWRRDKKMVLLAVERHQALDRPTCSPIQFAAPELLGNFDFMWQAAQLDRCCVDFAAADIRPVLRTTLEESLAMDHGCLEMKVPLSELKFRSERSTAPGAEAFVKVEDKTLLKRFQTLLDKSHKSSCNFTRDRNWASGVFENNTPVPTGYELVGAVRNENAALWRIYQVSKEVTRLDCAKPLKEAPFKKWTPLTMEAGKGFDWSDFDICEDANEWILFHASIPEALSAICRTGFTMAKLGSGGTTGGGGLYGDGTYFADSITKADEYARRKVEKGDFAGCRVAAICRVLGGRHFYMDKDVMEKDKPKFAKRVLEGHYNSTVGDRLKVKNTFREYVAYDAAATYMEYLIYYRRKGVPAKHE